MLSPAALSGPFLRFQLDFMPAGRRQEPVAVVAAERHRFSGGLAGPGDPPCPGAAGQSGQYKHAVVNLPAFNVESGTAQQQRSALREPAAVSADQQKGRETGLSPVLEHRQCDRTGLTALPAEPVGKRGLHQQLIPFQIPDDFAGVGNQRLRRILR